MSIDLLEHDLQTHNNGLEPLNTNGPLTPDLLRKIDAYWRAAN